MPEFWFKRGVVAWILSPLSLLYYLISGVRRCAYRTGLLAIWKAPVAVVVVGNITSGGAGKTPLTIALVEALKAKGRSVAVVSRGYRGAELGKPLLLDSTTTAAMAGDEPVLIYESTGVPVCVFPKRVDAVKALLEHHKLDVIVCDDGLQHYALGRDVEIAVVNTDTLYGNGWLLPSGPLREPVSRLAGVDFIVRNERPVVQTVNRTRLADEVCSTPGTPAGDQTFRYTMETIALCRLDGQQRVDVTEADSQQQLADIFAGNELVAKPAIANPQRFFDYLQSLGLDFVREPERDHHKFSAGDFSRGQGTIYLVTEKDKVKCRDLPIDASRIWYTETAVRMELALTDAFTQRVHDIIASKPLA